MTGFNRCMLGRCARVRAEQLADILVARYEQEVGLRQSFIAALSDCSRGEDWALQSAPSEQRPKPNSIMIAPVKVLLQAYSCLTQQVVSTKDQFACDQRQDDDLTRLKAIIADQGKRVGLQVKRRLLECTGQIKGDNEEHVPLSEHTVWTQFGTRAAGVIADVAETNKVKADEVAWHRAAKHAERGVKRLVKHLPDESD